MDTYSKDQNQELRREGRNVLTIAGQIDAAVDREEVVHLPLGAVLGGELLRRDVHQLDGLADLHVLLAFHGQKIFLDYNAIIKRQSN